MPLGVVAYFYGISPDTYLGSITAGADGHLWFTEGPTRRIGRITTAGLWLAIGVILATLAPEIVRLVDGQWGQVLQALY
jgi:hypothetical protein